MVVGKGVPTTMIPLIRIEVRIRKQMKKESLDQRGRILEKGNEGDKHQGGKKQCRRMKHALSQFIQTYVHTVRL